VGSVLLLIYSFSFHYSVVNRYVEISVFCNTFRKLICDSKSGIHVFGQTVGTSPVLGL